jgi:hypothetical protein
MFGSGSERQLNLVDDALQPRRTFAGEWKGDGGTVDQGDRDLIPWKGESDIVNDLGVISEVSTGDRDHLLH